jgi:hypothetical protein
MAFGTATRLPYQTPRAACDGAPSPAPVSHDRRGGGHSQDHELAVGQIVPEPRRLAAHPTSPQQPFVATSRMARGWEEDVGHGGVDKFLAGRLAGAILTSDEPKSPTSW